MSRKRGRIYYKGESGGIVVATRTDSHGVKHSGRGSNRFDATAALHRAEKGKNVSSTTQPLPAAE